MRQLRAVLGDAFASRRARLWYAACAAAVGAVVLKEISLLLASFQPSGAGQVYSADVFTRWRFSPVTGTDDIEAAWAVWTASGDLGRRLVLLHTLVDLALFIPGYCVLAYVLLRRVGTRPRPALAVVAVLAAADVLETVATLVVLPLLQRPGLAWLIGLSSDVKWLVVLLVGLVLLLRWLIPDEGADARSATRRLQARWRGSPRKEDRPGPLLRLRPQVLLVAVFAALVALPAGGPLDQVPDVLRSHVEDLSPGRVLELTPSFLALGALMAAVVLSGWRGSLLDLEASSPRRAPLSPVRILALALLAGAAGAAVSAVVGGFAAASLALGLVLLAAAAVPALGRRLARWSLVREPPPRRVRDLAQVPMGAERAELRTWLGALAGVLALAGSVGLVRATIRPVLVGGDFRVWLAVSLLLAFLGPPALHSLACSRWLTRRRVERAGRVAPAVAGLALLLLALWPRVLGRGLGSTGTVAVVFACVAVLLGQAQRHAERTRPWDAVRWLRLGRRTPVVGIVVVAWLVASVWDTEGGYHDARVLAEPHRVTYTSIEDAWRSWRDSTPSCVVGAGAQRVRPLLLVAAPGGGIRAAYWTASALDRLSAACPGSVFAVSGVSGGSVGTMAWAYGRSAGTAVPGRDLVGAIAGDDALAAGVAALLTRDLPRSLLALRGGFDDRAAVTEKAWESEMRAPTGRPEGTELPFDQLATRRGQDPVVVLNGSSATDGCRVLMSNVDSLAAGTGSCQGLPADGRPGPALSAAVTATDGLLTGKPALASSCSPGSASLRGTTAALLSARFPIVSPSGALRRCVDGKVAPAYVLDGGYYENSGLLSLLQIWEGLQASVQANNSPTSGAVPVQPWIVVLDNHYRSTAGPAPVRRAPELRMPLIGNGNAKATISTAALEQVAATEMAGCLRHVAPRAEPDVAAPLGWVLSATSRRQLDGQLPAALGQPDPARPPDWLTRTGCAAAG